MFNLIGLIKKSEAEKLFEVIVKEHGHFKLTEYSLTPYTFYNKLPYTAKNRVIIELEKMLSKKDFEFFVNCQWGKFVIDNLDFTSYEKFNYLQQRWDDCGYLTFQNYAKHFFVPMYTIMFEKTTISEEYKELL